MTFFFLKDTATTENYTLSLHDALPICRAVSAKCPGPSFNSLRSAPSTTIDRKSTRLNSSHLGISYAVFCLKKKSSEHPSIRSVNGDFGILIETKSRGTKNGGATGHARR